MRIGFASRLAVGLFAVAVQDPGGHTGSFEEVLEHRSFADLRQWRDAHPWSLGDRLGARLEGLLETRRVGERLAKERADLEAAFLAEALAEDPFSGWIREVIGWDAEACSHHETELQALAALADQPQLGSMVLLVREAKGTEAREQAAEALASTCRNIKTRHGSVNLEPLAQEVKERVDPLDRRRRHQPRRLGGHMPSTI